MARELGLPYVPIEPGICDSGRMGAYLDLMDGMGCVCPEWRVIKLLLWAGEHRPDGNLGSMGASVMSRGTSCGCPCGVPPVTLRDILVRSGWLVEKSGEFYIEGWERHGGRLLKKRKQYRERKARTRALPNVPRDMRGTPAGVPVLKGKVLGEEAVTPPLSAGAPAIQSDEPFALTSSPKKEKTKSTKKNSKALALATHEEAAVQRVWEGYCKYHPLCSVPMPEEHGSRPKILARLKSFTVAQLLVGVEGYHRHEWHVREGQLSTKIMWDSDDRVQTGISLLEAETATIKTTAELRHEKVLNYAKNKPGSTIGDTRGPAGLLSAGQDR